MHSCSQYGIDFANKINVTNYINTMAKRKTYFDRDFVKKGNKLYFNGTQIKLTLQCSFMGCTWTKTIKFPKKVTDFNKCNDDETYYTLLEYYDDIAKLNVRDNHYMRVYRDEKKSAMIVTRIE